MLEARVRMMNEINEDLKKRWAIVKSFKEQKA